MKSKQTNCSYLSIWLLHLLRFWENFFCTQYFWGRNKVTSTSLHGKFSSDSKAIYTQHTFETKNYIVSFLIALHAITGCNSVPILFGIGKITAWTTFASWGYWRRNELCSSGRENNSSKIKHLLLHLRITKTNRWPKFIGLKLVWCC